MNRNFGKGQEVIKRDLDVSKVLEGVKRANSLEMALLDEKQRLMLDFQLNQVINSRDNHSSNKHGKFKSDPKKAFEALEQIFGQIGSGASQLMTDIDYRLLKGMARNENIIHVTG